MTFFKKIQNHYFHSQTEGNSCHPEGGEEEDSRALELGHELAWSWNSSQQSTGRGEGMAVLRLLTPQNRPMSQDPGFKFPGHIHWLFLRKFLEFKNSFSVEYRFIQAPWYFQIWVNGTSQTEGGLFQPISDIESSAWLFNWIWRICFLNKGIS